jgi:hypothetical protein
MILEVILVPVVLLVHHLWEMPTIYCVRKGYNLMMKAGGRDREDRQNTEKLREVGEPGKVGEPRKEGTPRKEELRTEEPRKVGEPVKVGETRKEEPRKEVLTMKRRRSRGKV